MGAGLMVVLALVSLDAAARDRAHLQGTWKLVAMEGGSIPENLERMQVSAAELAESIGLLRMTLKFQGERLTLRRAMGHSDTGGKKVFQMETSPGRYRLDPAKQPKHIDVTLLDPGNPGENSALLGIYRLEGKRLKVRLGNESRPTSFAPDSKLDDAVLVFERVGP